ncbi:hypothetical protein [Ferrovum sp.]|uniref:hypothetical protein n=1 Tax=Ferrovum sp. TaxID=2609467 RepID=UPI002604B31E|nr:hypothetical protein [Ferrovum sp.]
MKRVTPLFELPGLDPVFPRIERCEVLGLAPAEPGYFVLLQDPKSGGAAACGAQRLPIAAWLLLRTGELRPVTAGQCEWTEIQAILCPDGTVIAGEGMRQ